MKLIDFFNRESDAPKAGIIFMAIVAGLTSVLMLVMINTAAATASSNEEVQGRLFFLYIISFILFLFSKNHSSSQATIAVEQVIYKVRMRIADKIRSSELPFVEGAGRGDIYTRLTQDTNFISQSANIILSASQALVILFFSLFYIAWLSFIWAFVIIGILFIAVKIFLVRTQQISPQIHETIQKENEFFDVLDHLLSGFKELKVNRRKNEAVFAAVQTIAEETRRLKTNIGLEYAISSMFSPTAFYILFAIILFIMPSFNPTHHEIVTRITATLLFIVGPIELLVGTIPMFTQATIAIENICALEAALDASIANNPTSLMVKPCTEFKVIQFEGVSFDYLNQQGQVLFSLGTLDMTIKQGEILFIIGGNGSGKSTFLKLLTGLYYPTRGTLSLDGEIIDPILYPAYRELFAIIFTDFHLFDRLYGLEDVDDKQVKQLLQTFGLEKKTRYVDGRFTNLNLSTGQKKRLAYIAAALENKAIYIFDEWAADQDPNFRRYFYEVLLKDLKAQGKTVIAVSHDDRYFHTADRVLKLEYGQLVDH